MKYFITTLAMAVGLCRPAFPQAYEPFIAQIMTFSGNYCPLGWSKTDGALLQISQNAVLFNIIGTTYGGDGVTTFALPKMQPIYTQTRAPLTTCIATQGVYPSQN